MVKQKDWIDREVQALFRLGKQSGLRKMDIIRRFQDGEPLTSLVPKYLETPGGAMGLSLVTNRLCQTLPPSPAQVEANRLAQEKRAGQLSTMFQVLQAWERLPDSRRLQESLSVWDHLAQIRGGTPC